VARSIAEAPNVRPDSLHHVCSLGGARLLAYAEIALGVVLFLGGLARPITAAMSRVFGADVSARGSWLHGLVSTTAVCGGFFLIGAGVLVFAAPRGPWVYMAPIALLLALMNRPRFGGPTPAGQFWRVSAVVVAASLILLAIATLVRFGMGLPTVP